MQPVIQCITGNQTCSKLIILHFIIHPKILEMDKTQQLTRTSSCVVGILHLIGT